MTEIKVFGNRAFLSTKDNLSNELIEEINRMTSHLPNNAHWIARSIIEKKKQQGEKFPTFDIENLRKFLFNKTNYSFPSGLINTIANILEIYDHEVDINYQFGFPPTLDLEKLLDENEELWKHQKESIKQASKNPRGIFKLPTGSGKTYLAVRIWKLWGRKITLVLVPNNSIANQWIDEMKDFAEDMKIGRWFGKNKPEIGIFNIMTYSMAYSIRDKWNDKRDKYKKGNKLMNSVKMCFVDEAHRVGATDNGEPNRTYEILMSLSKIENIYGLSATAQMRTDKSDIYQIASMGDLLANIDPIELVEKGILALPKIKFILIPPENFRRKKKGENSLNYYRLKYEKMIIHNDRRNRLAIKEALRMVVSEKRQVIMFCKEVDHLRELYRLFFQFLDHFEIFFSHGQDPEKDDKINRFKAGGIDILIATTKLVGEGLDVRPLSGIVYLIGEKSESELAQAIGRAMRKYKDKFDCKIIDFADGSEPFSSNTIARLTYYNKQCYSLDLKQCEWLYRYLS